MLSTFLQLEWGTEELWLNLHPFQRSPKILPRASFNLLYPTGLRGGEGKSSAFLVENPIQII